MNKKKIHKEEILTVCANCRKVRTDDGEWLHDLYFLQKFPSVKVSHSICPKCLKQLYPYLDEATLARTASEKQNRKVGDQVIKKGKLKERRDIRFFEGHFPISPD